MSPDPWEIPGYVFKPQDKYPNKQDVAKDPSDLLNAALGKAGDSGSSSGSSGGGGGYSLYGSSGGGGGGGGVPAAPPPPYGYLELIQSLGIPITGNLTNLAQKGVTEGYNQGEFMWLLRQTPEYKAAFPGIFKPDGTLRMTESEYTSLSRAYRHLAAAIGRKVSPEMLGMLIKREVSPEEFQQRTLAVQRIQEYKPMWNAFANALHQAGILKPGASLSSKDIFQFVMRRGPKEWYDVWENASIRTAIYSQGLGTVGKSSIFTGKDIKDIQRRIGGKVLAPEDFEEYAQALAEGIKLMPLSQLAGFGLTKGDIKTLALGGERRQEIMGKAEQAIRNVEGASQPRAAPQMVVSRQGTELLGYADEEVRSP